jgi:hypothetical protein
MKNERKYDNGKKNNSKTSDVTKGGKGKRGNTFWNINLSTWVEEYERGKEEREEKEVEMGEDERKEEKEEVEEENEGYKSSRHLI